MDITGYYIIIHVNDIAARCTVGVTLLKCVLTNHLGGVEVRIGEIKSVRITSQFVVSLPRHRFSAFSGLRHLHKHCFDQFGQSKNSISSEIKRETKCSEG